MLGSLTVLAGLALFSTPSLTDPGAMSSRQCGVYDSFNCSPEDPNSNNDGDGVDVWDDDDRGGSDPGSGGDPGGGGGPSRPPLAPPDPDKLDDCRDPWDEALECYGLKPDPEEAEPGLPPITIGDLVRFVPDDAISATEPGNVAVVGLPANAVNDGGVEESRQSLLGRDISVRFTPVSYEFDFGDGSALSSSTGGASWAALGQAQFTPTATSHVYAARGSYTLSVSVVYRAEIEFGRGWLPVDGTVTGPASTATIQVYEARTALVGDSCAENPRGPGC